MKIVKVLLCIAVLTFVIFCPGIVAALEDGEYTINVEALNVSNNAPSMADQYIKSTAKLEIKNGATKAVVTITEGDLMQDFAVRTSSGHYQLAEVISENKSRNEITYRFPVASLEQPLAVQSHVIPMGMNVDFRLSFDKSSVRKIQEASKAEENKGNTSEIKTSSNNSDTKTKNQAVTANTGQANKSQQIAKPKESQGEQQKNEKQNEKQNEKIENSENQVSESNENTSNEESKPILTSENSDVIKEQESEDVRTKTNKVIFPAIILLLVIAGICIKLYFIKNKKKGS